HVNQFWLRSETSWTHCSLLCRQESRSFPESYPELPKQDTVESSLLQKHILELATMLDVQSLFWDDSLESY
ncbi:hypothetical protein XENOCAPTIV_028570, partial [Xenoophorus captivus]